MDDFGLDSMPAQIEEVEMSKDISELAAALSEAQAEYEHISKDQSGYGYKYENLPSVINSISQVNRKHGLSVSQPHWTLGDHDYIFTLLMHKSGQWIKSKIKLRVDQSKKMSPMQRLGASITYGRRYALQAICGVAAEEDRDDAPEPKETQQDQAYSNSPKQQQAKQAKPIQKTTTLGQAVNDLLKGLTPKEVESIKLSAGYSANSESLTKEQKESIYGKVKHALEKHKENRDSLAYEQDKL